MNPKEPGFRYTYSAKEQREIEAIRKKYAPSEERQDKMATLRRMDRRVTEKGSAVALILGILGTLLLGTGMSLFMTPELRGLAGRYAMPVGIGLGAVGILLILLAYPIYRRVVRRERKKIAPVILKLTEELMK